MLQYVQALGLDASTEDPMEFLKAFQESRPSSSKGVGLVLDLIRQCRLGNLGGMVFEEQTVAAHHQHGDELVINRNSPIVCINEDAKHLIDIGTGQAELTPLPKTPNANKPLKKNHSSHSRDYGQPFNHSKEERRLGEATTTSLAGTGSNKTTRVVLLPKGQRDFNCMKCAGFIKQSNFESGSEYCGVRHTKVIGWDEHDIRSYFSRMLEAFEGHKSSHKKYLMRDSLACTLAAKYKLRSRQKVYKKLGKSLGGYPVSNKDRSRRFQSDQPVPLNFECTGRSKGSCRAGAEDENAETRTRSKSLKS